MNSRSPFGYILRSAYTGRAPVKTDFAVIEGEALKAFSRSPWRLGGISLSKNFTGQFRANSPGDLNIRTGVTTASAEQVRYFNNNVRNTAIGDNISLGAYSSGALYVWFKSQPDE